MKKVSRIITRAAVVGMAAVAAACAKNGGHSGANYNFTLWTGFGNDYTKAVDAIVNEFNDKHSGSVEILNVKKGDYDGLLGAILLTLTNDDNLPNITHGYPDHFAEYWKKGIINPLDDYIDRYNREHSCNIINDFYSDYMTENRKIGFDDATGEAYTLGIPFNKSTEVMLCNGYMYDFFKQEDPSISVPTTWEELAALTPKITNIVTAHSLTATTSNYLIGTVGNDGHATGIRVSAVDDHTGSEKVLQDLSNIKTDKPFYVLGYDSSDNGFITMLHQWNVPYTEYSYNLYKTNDQYGKALFWKDAAAKEGTKSALNFFVKLFDKHGFGVPDTFGESLYCTTPLNQGRCLFTIGSSGGLNKPEVGRLDLYPIPYHNGGTKAVISQGTSLALINQFTSVETYEEEMYKAFETMVEFSTGSLQAKWCAKTGYFPASQSAYDDDAYQEVLHGANPTPNEALYRKSGTINENTYKAGGWTRFVDDGFVGSNNIRSKVKAVFHNVFTFQGRETNSEHPDYETKNLEAITSVLDTLWNGLDDRLK